MAPCHGLHGLMICTQFCIMLIFKFLGNISNNNIDDVYGAIMNDKAMARVHAGHLNECGPRHSRLSGKFTPKLPLNFPNKYLLISKSTFKHMFTCNYCVVRTCAYVCEQTFDIKMHPIIFLHKVQMNHGYHSGNVSSKQC